MPKPDKLNKTARRQLDGPPGPSERVADRMELVLSAGAFMGRLGIDDYDIMDVLALAEFLNGDEQVD